MVESDSARSNAEGSDNAPAPKKARTSRARPDRSRVPDSARGVSAGTGSVCKLFVRKVPSNFTDPWRKHGQQSVTGTGFLVQGRWIVTNAHVVHRAVSVLACSPTGPPIKYNAKVAAVGLPCDLAVLSVDTCFWTGKESLELSPELPRLDDNVTCIGFPVGGENISVTRGVVSRVDVNHEGLLRIQIDAAINPGNSGGPVLGAHGLVVGVVASHLKNASNIGYIIPTAVLQQFLECTETPGLSYIGTASLGIGRVQTLESPVLRRAPPGSWPITGCYPLSANRMPLPRVISSQCWSTGNTSFIDLSRHLQLPDSFKGGVRVPAVWPMGPTAEKLRSGDVLLQLDGVEIGQDATVPLRNNERISFQYLVTRHLAGRDISHLVIWRNGAKMEVDVALQPDRWLVPRVDGYDAAPEYLVIGGLVFVPLSQPWAELKPKDKSARALLSRYWGLALPEAGKQVVILSKVLAHPCNVGFHALGNVVLDTFDGVPVHNLVQLARAVTACKSEDFVFEFLRPAGDGKDLVALNRAECAAAEADVLHQHLIAVTCMVLPDGFSEPQPLCMNRDSADQACEHRAGQSESQGS